MKKALLGLLVASALAWLVIATLAPGVVGRNFHAVVPAAVYRSGQLNGVQLEEAIERFGLKAIINLRGHKPDRHWYQQQAQIAQERGLAMADLNLTPKRLPPAPAVLELIQLLESLPAPILLHCHAGSDRTGFASVLARMVRGGASLEEARSELSLWYGHFPFGPSSEVSRIYDLYRQELVRTGRSERSVRIEDFRHWVRSKYVPYVYSGRIESVSFPGRSEARARHEVAFRITNTSPGVWKLKEARDEGIKLGFRLQQEGERRWVDYDRMGYFGLDLAPGQAVEIGGAFWAPEREGRFTVKVDLVDEHVTWFEEQGSSPLVLTLWVQSGEEREDRTDEAR
ncbi:MAG: tyrosine-protein phosphatase [Acidobacteriota bacterium]